MVDLTLFLTVKRGLHIHVRPDVGNKQNKVLKFVLRLEEAENAPGIFLQPTEFHTL